MQLQFFFLPELILHKYSVEGYFDTGWDEIPLSVTKIPQDDILDSLYKLRVRGSAQLKNDMDTHQKTSMPNYQKLKTMVKRSTDQKLRLRNFDAWKRKNWDRCSGYESQEIQWHWKRKGNLLSVESKKVSARRETNAVSGTRVTVVRNRHRKPLHRLSHQHQEVEVRREKGASEAEASLGRPIDSRAKTSWKVLALIYVGDYWHPPECQFYKYETGRKFGAECSFPHWKVEEPPNKGRRRVVTKVQ